MSADETRTMHVGFIYNWETRAKKFVLWSDAGDAARTLGSGEQLYLLGFTLEPPKPGADPIQHAWCHFVRHENTEPLPPDRTLHEWLLSRLDGHILQSLPRNTFGPEKGPYKGRIVSFNDKQSVNAFSVPGHHFKLTIEEITEEEYEALPLPAFRPSGGRGTASDE